MTTAGWPLPVTLTTRDGPIPAIWRDPGRDIALRDFGVLFVPPFAEEMNRTRRLMALVGQQLAAVGVPSLLPDLPGTGDSPQPFSTARWEAWRSAVATCAAHIADRGLAVRLAGFRLGALLAADATANGLAVQSLALVDPVEDGRMHIRHWLRIRSAASLEIGPRITLSYLQSQLESGATVEVAGYDMHPELAAAINSLKLAPLLSAADIPTLRLDVIAPGSEATTQTPSRRFVAAEAPWASYEPAEPTYLAEAVTAMILETA